MKYLIDNFLSQSDYDKLRAHASDLAVFKDIQSPVDGVVYPNIASVPDELIEAVLSKIEEIGGIEITQSTTFLRMSPEGVQAPNRAHNDATMGDYSLMLYLNFEEHCEGGTEVLRHIETEHTEGPVSDELAAKLQEDSNNDEAWEVLDLADMYPNRAFIFDASVMHRAVPSEGFGTEPRDARLVLTTFFSVGLPID